MKPTNPVRPDDHVSLLAEAVRAARRAPFWRGRLSDARNSIESLADFERLPITAVSDYRRQRFDALLSDASGIEWIPGPWLGQSPGRAAVAEGAAETAIRVELLRGGLGLAVPDRANAGELSAVAVATETRRYFGAEACAAFVRMGISAHLLVDTATDRLEGLLDVFQPDIVVALSSRVDMGALPGSVRAVVTVSAGGDGETHGDNYIGHPHPNLPPSRGKGLFLMSDHGRVGDKPIRRVNLLVQNELGVLGAAADGGSYRMNHHRFHMEESPGETVVATPYYTRVQPIIRLDTGIPASVIH